MPIDTDQAPTRCYILEEGKLRNVEQLPQSLLGCTASYLSKGMLATNQFRGAPAASESIPRSTN